MQNKTKTKKPSQWRQATDYSHNMNGFTIPKRAIYGTFREYTQEIKWIVPHFPKSDTAQYTILVYVMGKWTPAKYHTLPTLCRYIDSIIYDNFFAGSRTDAGRIAETFQSSAPFGRCYKMTALKTANKMYLQRADNGNNDRYCTVYQNGDAVDHNTKSNILY